MPKGAQYPEGMVTSSPGGWRLRLTERYRDGRIAVVRHHVWQLLGPLAFGGTAIIYDDSVARTLALRIYSTKRRHDLGSSAFTTDRTA